MNSALVLNLFCRNYLKNSIFFLFPVCSYLTAPVCPGLSQPIPLCQSRASLRHLTGRATTLILPSNHPLMSCPESCWLNPWSRAHSNSPRMRTRVGRMKGGPQARAVATVTSFYPFSPKSCQPLGDGKQSRGKKEKRTKWEKAMLTRKGGEITCLW